jgi:threonine synthase
MKYVSTRGGADSKTFEQVVLEGLAPDGGLYVPESFPQYSLADMQKMANLSYPELAVRVMKDFVAPDLSPGELAALVQEAYSKFAAPDVIPMRKVEDGFYLLELFHGPTLAFKDVALQFLGRVFGHFAHKRGREFTVVGATSGDTGSAAISGCMGIKGVKVFILYPHERPSDIQRRQMTTVSAANVHALAVQGSFDDCQALVKDAFRDPVLKPLNITAVNSINWARIIAQTVYYFWAGLKAGALNKPVNFVVPSGNFGNLYAGYVAKRLGLPVNKLVAATNKNDALSRFVNEGKLVPGKVEPSLSPSMDIQIPSNLERYLFELLGRDSGLVNGALQAQKTAEGYTLPSQAVQGMQQEFAAMRVDDGATTATIQGFWNKAKILLDPHTAVGVHAALQLRNQLEGGVIALACADPAKFPETVRAATGQIPALPPFMADIGKVKERFTILPNSGPALREFILKH